MHYLETPQEWLLRETKERKERWKNPNYLPTHNDQQLNIDQCFGFRCTAYPEAQMDIEDINSLIIDNQISIPGTTLINFKTNKTETFIFGPSFSNPRWRTDPNEPFNEDTSCLPSYYNKWSINRTGIIEAYGYNFFGDKLVYTQWYDIVIAQIIYMTFQLKNVVQNDYKNIKYFIEWEIYNPSQYSLAVDHSSINKKISNNYCGLYELGAVGEINKRFEQIQRDLYYNCRMVKIPEDHIIELDEQLRKL